jgi:ABC-type sugar transport system ATPase subunit
MASVEFEGICKSFGATPALRDVSFRIDDGEFFVIVGPSGCGKSTLLRLVAGLEFADSGAIRIDGRDVSALPPKDRGVAMVFQSYALYPHWTVAQNIAFPLKIRGVPRKDLERRVEAIASALQLTSQRDKRPKELSGGQRQRVALGRAMAADPKIFLFDEPLSNLDAPLRAEMRREIVSQQKSLGKTALYVTHDQTEALTMADRIAVLDAGVVLGVGSPAALYTDPPNHFVASFLGRPTLNLFPAEIRAAGESFVLEPLRWKLDVGAGGRSLPQRVEVGIRPEHLRLDLTSEDRAWAVAAREFLGDKIQYTVTLGASQLTVLADAHDPIAVGAMTALAPIAARIMLFHPEDGRRLL